MVRTRRRFLSTLALVGLSPCMVGAYPLETLLGQPNPRYVRAYLSRFWKWYNSTWFPFFDEMSQAERHLFGIWRHQVTHFGQKQGPQAYYENFLVRHHLKGDGKFHGRYYAGLPQWFPEGRLALKNFLLEELHAPALVDFDQMDIFGWARDFDSKKIKLFIKSPQEGEYFSKHGMGRNSLGFIEYQNKEEVRRGLITPVQNPPLEAHPNLHPKTILSGFKVSDNIGNVSWKVRTQSTFLLPLKTGVMRVAALHKLEFHQNPDLVDVSQPDQLKVYYP